MPTSVWQRLDLGELKHFGGRVQLADRSFVIPRGMLEDVPVKVGKFYVPADFLVMDIPEDVHIPIILGRPFLRTAGAVIDMKNGNLTLEVGDETIKFNLSQVMRGPMLEQSVNQVDVIDECVNDLWRDSQLRDPYDYMTSSVACVDSIDAKLTAQDALAVVMSCEGLSQAQREKIEGVMRPSLVQVKEKAIPKKEKPKAKKKGKNSSSSESEGEGSFWRVRRDKRKLQVKSLNAAVEHLNLVHPEWGCMPKSVFDADDSDPDDPYLKFSDGVAYFDPGEDF